MKGPRNANVFHFTIPRVQWPAHAITRSHFKNSTMNELNQPRLRIRSDVPGRRAFLCPECGRGWSGGEAGRCG